MTKQEERYLPLVKTVADQIKRNAKTNVSLEEMIQIGMVRLRKALSEFSTRHGTTFRMFAQYRIRSAIYKEAYTRGEDDIRLMATVNELMRFRSEAAESATKRSVNVEASELKEMIQCLIAVWLMDQYQNSKLASQSVQGLKSALAEMDDHQKTVMEQSSKWMGSVPVLELRRYWKVMEKIRVSMTRKFAEKSTDKI